MRRYRFRNGPPTDTIRLAAIRRAGKRRIAARTDRTQELTTWFSEAPSREPARRRERDPAIPSKVENVEFRSGAPTLRVVARTRRKTERQEASCPVRATFSLPARNPFRWRD